MLRCFRVTLVTVCGQLQCWQLSDKGVMCHWEKLTHCEHFEHSTHCDGCRERGRELMRNDLKPTITWMRLTPNHLKSIRWIDLISAPNGGGGGGLMSKPTSGAHCRSHLDNIWSSSGTGCFWNFHGNILFLKTVLNNGHWGHILSWTCRLNKVSVDIVKMLQDKKNWMSSL